MFPQHPAMAREATGVIYLYLHHTVTSHPEFGFQFGNYLQKNGFFFLILQHIFIWKSSKKDFFFFFLQTPPKTHELHIMEPFEMF